eukprot:TRINITY_DN3272_c0_g1_i1.p1 TRINITY_DN3272_c0_g1~~TRINITY_DN3272_c0_g1_i1.p1  ORF type:complete len:415 (+),score=50.88 TRINITY_DN3272_c0_g1_i1:154-1398(+)
MGTVLLIDVHDNITYISTLIGFVLLFSVAVSFGTQKIERWLKSKKHKNLKAMLHEFYKELTLVGMFSLFLFLLNYTNASKTIGKWYNIDPQTSEDLIEEIHMMLFAGAVVYIVMVLVLMAMCAQIISHWKSSEQTPQAVLEHKHRIYLSKQLTASCFNLRFKWRFVQQQNLSDAFDFAGYLEYCLQRNCIQLVEVHFSIWILVLGIVFLNWAKSELLERFHVTSDVELSATHLAYLDELLFWLVVGYGLLFVCIVVFFKCRKIYNQLVNFKSSNMPIGTNEDVSGDVGRMYDAQELFLTRRLLSETTQHKKLFWFNSPQFLFRLIQVVLLFQAYYFAGWCVYFNRLNWNVFLKVLPMIPPILTVFFYAPAVLGTFSLIVNIEEFTKADTVYKFQEKCPPLFQNTKLKIINISLS